MNRIEEYGTGFRKVFSYCLEAGVEVFYKDDEQGFSFEFERTPINPMYATEAEIQLDAAQFAVYRLIKRNDKITIEEITTKVAKSHRTVARLIDELKQKGFLKRVGGTRGYWKLLK